MPGGYFVTFSTYRRVPLLGKLEKENVILSESGKAVLNIYRKLPDYYPNLQLDQIQIMPDHIHCILMLVDPVFHEIRKSDCATLPQIVKRFKDKSARTINKMLNRENATVWQKGYYERVIRSDRELEKFRSYIITNPRRVSFRISE